MRNLHRRFDRYYIGQIYGGDFAKFCDLLRIYELYLSSLMIRDIKIFTVVHRPYKYFYTAHRCWTNEDSTTT